jgi:hypothetical protein
VTLWTINAAPQLAPEFHQLFSPHALIWNITLAHAQPLARISLASRCARNASAPPEPQTGTVRRAIYAASFNFGWLSLKEESFKADGVPVRRVVDLCAYTYPGPYHSGSAADPEPPDMGFGGIPYLIQENWVNAKGGFCALSWDE